MADQLNYDAIDEITFLKNECKKLIRDSLSICTPDANGDYPEPVRIVVTPFLYAVWERCFRTSLGIMLRLVREKSPTPAEMTALQATLWLQKEPFLKSFLDVMKHRPLDAGEVLNRKAVNSGSYKSLVDFTTKLFNWHATHLSSGIDTADLVMTFSNVNVAVFELNAEAVGLTTLTEFTEFRKNIGRLDDLVGRRNDISHGTLSYYPGNKEFKELLTLVEEHLITRYCELVQIWILFH